MTLIMLIFYLVALINISKAEDDAIVLMKKEGFKNAEQVFDETKQFCIDETSIDERYTHIILGTATFTFFTTFTICLICSNCMGKCFTLFCCGISGNIIGCIVQIVTLIYWKTDNEVAKDLEAL